MESASEDAPQFDRRQLLGSGLVVAAAVSTPFAIWSRVNAGEQGPATERQRGTLARVAQLVIPRTDTPGAADVGTHDFVILALAHGLDGTRDPASSAELQGANSSYRRQDGSLNYLAWLEDQLNLRSRGDFAGAAPQVQLAALTAVNDKAYAGGQPDSPWKKIKSLILTGYYTSEAGGSQELRYELVPGRHDPNLPLSPGDRAWSSDWTAVDFG